MGPLLRVDFMDKSVGLSCSACSSSEVPIKAEEVEVDSILERLLEATEI